MPATRGRLPLALLLGMTCFVLLDAPDTGSGPSRPPPTTRVSPTAPSPTAPSPTSPSPTSPEGAPWAAGPAVDDAAYVPGEVMVAGIDGTWLDHIARRHGTRVIREAGPSGYGSLAVPDGIGRAAFLDALLSDAGVLDAAANARIRGASTTARPARANAYQWHLGSINAPAVGALRCDGVVVAVIDSGVAYENYNGAVRAPSLATATFVAPWDFVNGDAHPNDDHMHGTHIASLIASEGVVEGVCPGASIMPLKVLDSDNSGTELSLLDSLAWALANGADVVNLSLAFDAGYAPSVALSEAIEALANADVILVGAAGNAGTNDVSQPAANPLVIAVGGDRPLRSGVNKVAAYANRSTRIDIAAPSGDLLRDATGDGYMDGLLAETIRPQDPTHTGYYFMVGTSQSAALVSGAAAALLHAGAAPSRVKEILEHTAGVAHYAIRDYVDFAGGGRLDLTAALAKADGVGVPAERDFHVAILPWLADLGATVAPMAMVTVLDEQGGLQDGVTVAGMVWGSTGKQTASCVTVAGMCTLRGHATSWTPGLDHAWAFSVDQVIADGAGYHPRAAFFWSEGLDAVVGAMLADADASDAMLGFHWRAGTEDTLGAVQESYILLNHGTGLASTPLGVVLTPSKLASADIVASGTITYDGTGLASAPLTFTRIDGTGLASAPLGFTVFTLGTGLASAPMIKVLSLDGSGLASAPLGFSALTMLSGTGLASAPLGFTPVMLGSGLASAPLGYNLQFGTVLLGTSVLGVLDAGGWVTAGSQDGGSIVMASSDITGLAPARAVDLGAADGDLDMPAAVCPPTEFCALTED